MSTAEKSFLGPDGVSQLWDAVKGRRVELTLGEYNALSQEAKDNPGILYVITDDNGMGIDQPENVYSTKETKIGTWIDGKPLYRRVLTGKSATSTNRWNTIVNIKNIDFLSAYGKITANEGYVVAIPNTHNDIAYFQDNVMINVTHNSYTNMSFLLILMYTKTTD